MANFLPPPTYADVVIVDPATNKGTFNPLWLNWFLQIAQVLGTSGGSSGALQHNSLAGLQGGFATDFYHLTAGEHATVVGLPGTVSHNGLAGLQGGGGGDFYHLSAAEHTAIGSIPVLASGTYTPTLSNNGNISSSTAFSNSYLRVGSTVVVSGQVTIDPISAGVQCILGMTIPVASNFVNNNECAGVIAPAIVTGNTGACIADIVNNRAEFDFIAGTTVAQNFWFIFLYTII